MKFMQHPADGAIVLLHLFFMPTAVRRNDIALRSKFASQAGQQELFRGIHQINPLADTLLARQSGWNGWR
jgi:hypothetical protein